MASGSFFGNSPVNSTNLYVTWSSTTNVAANTSSVTVNLYMRHYALYATAVSGSYLSVGGNSSNYSKSISYGGSSQTDTLLTSKTVTVAHNADGSGTCNITGTFVLNGKLSGVSVGTITASQTVTLDRIPRSSNIDRIANSSGTTISSINSGLGIRVYWTPAATSYKYRIQCIVSGSTYTFPSASTFYSPNSVSSYYASITTAHSWIPSKPSDQVNVKLYTYDSSGTQIGDVKNGSFALNVPASIVPSISSFIPTIVDGKSGNYVLGKSKVTLTVNAEKGSGAANISYYTFNGPYVDGQKSSVVKTTTATSYTLTTGLLNSPDNQSYSVTVTDTRGRSTTIPTPINIMVQPYSEPYISSVSVQRCDANGVLNPNGTYAYVTVNSSYASLNGTNTRTVVLSNSSDNYSAKTTIQSTTNTASSHSVVYGGSFAIGSTYTIRATITDTAYSSTNSREAPLVAAKRPLNILNNGNGVAIGKMAEINNTLEIEYPTKFNNGSTMAYGNIVFDRLNDEQGLVFNDCGSVNWSVYLNKGNSNSNTVFGLWDRTNSRNVCGYDSSGLLVTNRPIKIVGGIEYILIPNNTNLNTMMTPGFYKCPTNASVVTLGNSPTAEAFSMVIESHAGIKQTISVYRNDLYPVMYVRNYYNNAWGAWYRLSTSGDHSTLWQGNVLAGNTITLSENYKNFSHLTCLIGPQSSTWGATLSSFWNDDNNELHFGAIFTGSNGIAGDNLYGATFLTLSNTSLSFLRCGSKTVANVYLKKIVGWR